MRRKLVLAILIAIFLLSFINPVVFAEERGNPFLKESTIDIKANDNNFYEIIQEITIGDADLLSENEVMHTLSNINDVQINDLNITSENQELDYTIVEKDALNQYFLDLSGFEVNNINYKISYTVQLEEDEFTVPLFVPEFGSIAEENIVTINFEAPEEMVLQLNSFPVIKGNKGNKDNSFMMNIPSHVKYVFYSEEKYFNSFNIIGWGSLIAFLFVVFIWIRREIKKEKGAV